MARRPGYVPSTGSDSGFGVEIVGLPEVRAMLAKYQQPALDAKILRGEKAAGRVLAKGIRAAAPARVRRGVRPGFGDASSHRSGDLFRSIRSKTLRGSPPAVAVGPMSRMRHLAILPTRPHDIPPRRHPWLSVAGGFASVVHHPGNRAHPWVAQGIDQAHEAAIDAAANAIFRDFIADASIGGDD